MVKYEIRLANVPEGAATEHYICGPSNGDGNPDAARRVFDTKREATRVISEFRKAKKRRPDDFPAGMEAEIVEVSR